MITLHTEGKYKKSLFKNHEQSSSGVQKKSTELTLLEVEMCKHNKSTSKQKKKESLLKREHQK